MPGLNGTGPMGMGPMTGGGRGRCGGVNNPGAGNNVGGQDFGYGMGRGMRNGMGRGMGRGTGRGMGQGMGRNYYAFTRDQNAPQESVDYNDNDVLIQRLERLEAEAEKIRKQIGRLAK